MKKIQIAMMAAGLAIAMNAQAGAYFAVNYSGTYTASDPSGWSQTGTVNATGKIYIDGSGNATSASYLDVNWDGSSLGSGTLDSTGLGSSGAFSGDNKVFPAFPALTPVLTGLGLTFTDGSFDFSLVKGVVGYDLIGTDQGSTWFLESYGGRLDLTSAHAPEPATLLAGLGALGMMATMGWRNRKA